MLREEITWFGREIIVYLCSDGCCVMF